MEHELPGCARCHIDTQNQLCQNEEGKGPSFCPTQQNHVAIEQAMEELQKPDVFEFAKQASIQEGEAYANRELGYDQVKPAKPRIVEIIEFAHKMNFKRLGFVFCLGFRKEARVVEKILSSNGFEVLSAICKVGGVPKEEIDIQDDQKIHIGAFEPMCNPIAQAFMLNQEKTDYNVMMGLCVGHDSLFLKYAKAPCTVFAVKDRLLGHNPLAAIYTVDSYYRSLKNPAVNKTEKRKSK